MITAIIGGTGLEAMQGLVIKKREAITTPFGAPSAPLAFAELDGAEVIFLPRHGDHHELAPHQINYRANLWALKEAGAKQVIAVAAVGGITAAMAPEMLIIPDQIIDYSWGRESTFFDGDHAPVDHIDFTYPYDESLRQQLISTAEQQRISCVTSGVYGTTQGPRLETAAEIVRMERDGCDIVGMTGMPETVLAKELQLSYACCALVVNWAAGKTDALITMEQIQQHVDNAQDQVKRLLETLIRGDSNGVFRG